MDFVNYTSSQQTAKFDIGLRSFMVAVFNNMALGLLITSLSAYAFSNTALANLLYNINPQSNTISGFTVFGMIVAFAPLAFSLIFSMSFMNVSTNTAKMMFYSFSATMGASLSSVLLAYTGESVVRTFLITASMFGAMSLYGYTTKKDLTSVGSFLIMGLIGILIAGLCNIFFQSSALSFAISLIGVVIFVGLTAYDVQKIKSIYASYANLGEEAVGRMSIYGSFSLYMNFINLFLSLLRLFGSRRD